MARINKRALTKVEIIREASKQFLDKGYSHTTVSAICKELQMSPGNLTFHFPTKEHLLAELVDLLCRFQWKRMEEEADDGMSSIMALCLELTTMASASESDAVVKDFFISAYTSPMCMQIIRKNDAVQAKRIFGKYRTEWTDEQFMQAEILRSGIEYATLMTANDPVSFESRIYAALHSILAIFGASKDVRDANIRQVLAMNYQSLGKQVFSDFREFVGQANAQALQALLNQ